MIHVSATGRRSLVITCPVRRFAQVFVSFNLSVGEKCVVKRDAVGF